MATYYNNNNSNSSSCNNNNNNNNHSKIEDGAGGSGAGLQTLILMNPTTPYPHPQHLGSPFLNSDADQQQQQQQQQQHHQQNNSNNNNLVFLNSVATTLNPRAFSHAPFHPQQQQLLGIPLDHPRRPSHHEISALHHHALTPRVHYNNNIMYPGPMEGARDLKNGQQGGLSLTLSAPPTEARVSGGSTSSPEVSNKVNHAVLGSRYLKAAQELLDEVVSVGREVVRTKLAGESEITTAERQEIQMRKAKLVAMLDEVDQRYRQYHRQMQIVISWFEQETGIGSAKTYTALALQTISKQFRCLKDAISSQIRASSKSLGEEDSIGGSKNEGSRLKFVDHQIRQQKALQQLGMMQPNAWRPQRGLPERAVSVLRAWLFEHFLHPYPKDSDKIMLAKQTGLNRSQVSNWFINARVRLWKPMVEEMYMEEVKEQEHNGSDNKTAKSENNDEDSASKTNTLQEKTPATENQSMNFKSAIDMPTSQNSPSVISTSPSPTGVTIRNPPGFTLINSPDMGTIAQASPKKQRNTEFLQPPNNYLYNEQISMKFGDERHNRENLTLMGSPMNFIGGFGAYPIGEIGRFGAEQFPTTYSGNGVALTLGLPHSENLSLPGAHQSFLQNQNIQMGRRYEIGEPDEFAAINASNPSHSSVAYESINMQNRKRFAAQLLPDFVT